MRGGERVAPWPAFREAAALAAQLGDGEALARAAIGASRRYVQPPGIVDEELIALLEQALEMTARRARRVMRVRLLARLCGALYYSPERDRMRRSSAEATELAAELDDPEAPALAAAARRRAFWDPFHLEQRLADSTELLHAAREAGRHRARASRATPGSSSTCSSTATARRSTPRSRRSPPAPSELRQPLYLWQVASGARCGRCSPVT